MEHQTSFIINRMDPVHFNKENMVLKIIQINRGNTRQLFSIRSIPHLFETNLNSHRRATAEDSLKLILHFINTNNVETISVQSYTVHSILRMNNVRPLHCIYLERYSFKARDSWLDITNPSAKSYGSLGLCDLY
jgi:hypothetical protein